MPIDKKKLYVFCFSVLAILLSILFAPNGSGKIIAAIFLLSMAAVAHFLIKKRAILSMHSRVVFGLMGVIGLLYLMLYYISALRFGFTKTGYGLIPDIIFRLTLPIAIIIVSTEIIRFILCSQADKIASTASFFICLVADVLICSTFRGITNYATFMDVVGLTLFPGILYNALYNYLSVRYGIFPILIYRAFNVWIFYLIPYGSGISNSLIAFINLILPMVIFFFIDSLFEKRRKYALGQTSRIAKITSKIITAVAAVIMVGTVMLISNQFKYGALVIATESMTGEINKGDIVITESYDKQSIPRGQVIVFEKNGSMLVHRVVDIQFINGTKRYYTKGDANEDMDAGFVTDSEIVGLVNHKIPVIGYPTIWLRSLFK